MPHESVNMWVDAVSSGEPDSGETLTALQRLSERVVAPSVEHHGGRFSGAAAGGAVIVFPAASDAVAAARSIVAELPSTGPTLRVAIAGPDLSPLATELLEHAGPGGVVVAGLDVHEPSTAPETTIGRGDDQVVVTRIGRHRPRSVAWRRALTLGPLGGIGFAPIAARMGSTPSDDVIADPGGVHQERAPVHDPAPDAAAEASLDTAVEDEPDVVIAGIEVFADSPERRAAAEDAITRFEDAGLDLPDGLLLYFHDAGDYEQCGGHAAVATHADDWERIDMCTESEFTIFHEMAHIWAEEHLSDEEREAFLDNRDLDSWRDLGEEAADMPEYLAHGLRGSEHAADVIAWGLTGRFPQMIPDNDLKSLREAYTLLTGQENPPYAAAASPAIEDDPLGLSLVSSAAAAAPHTGPEPASMDEVTPLEPTDGVEFDADPFEADSADAAEHLATADLDDAFGELDEPMESGDGDDEIDDDVLEDEFEPVEQQLT